MFRASKYASRWIKTLITGLAAGMSPIRPHGKAEEIPLGRISAEEHVLEKSGADCAASKFDYRYLHARYAGPRADVREQIAMPVIPERERLRNRSIWRPDVEGFIRQRLHHDENVV